VAWDVDD
jgi:hypothetical protein